MPDIAKVRSYPVIERDPFVWIWTGDPAKAADAPPPPSFPWFHDDEWVTIAGQMPFAANYSLLQENVLDLTHFNYAHRKTFDVTDVPVPRYFQEGNKVWFVLDQRPFEITRVQREILNAQGHVLSRHMVATLEASAVHIFEMDMHDEDARPNDRSDYKTWVVHCATPEGPGKTRYWWIYGQDFGHAPGIHQIMSENIETAFLEDKVLMEGIQEMVERDPRHLQSTEVVFLGDMGGIMARRALKGMLEAGRG